MCPLRCSVAIHTLHSISDAIDIGFSSAVRRHLRGTRRYTSKKVPSRPCNDNSPARGLGRAVTAMPNRSERCAALLRQLKSLVPDARRPRHDFATSGTDGFQFPLQAQNDLVAVGDEFPAVLLDVGSAGGP